MLWSLLIAMVVTVVPDDEPGHIGLSMMVNIDPPTELNPAADAQKANRAMVMFFWNKVEGDTARRENYNFNSYEGIMSNLPADVSVLGVLGWGTPKWASRARWIYDTLMEHFHCQCAETLRSPYLDSCLYYQDIYTNHIKDRYFPPRPDSVVIDDSVVAYMDLWLSFVDTIVKRYSDRVKYYEIWYEMDPNPPKYSPWKEDFINTMKDTGWFYDSFYIPTAKVIYRACSDCKLVLPPEAGGNTLYDSYASFIPKEVAQERYHNPYPGKFYGYYDRMFSYFSLHPNIQVLYCEDSIRRRGNASG